MSAEEPSGASGEGNAAPSRLRNVVGYGGALAAAGVALAVGDVDDSGTRLAAIFVATAVLWITEVIPAAVSALAAVCACIAAGVTTSREAFASFGNPILFLFLGSFFVAEAMSVHGLGARFAAAVSSKAKGPFGVMLATSSAAFVLSMWTSNAAATALVLPIAVAAANALRDPSLSSSRALERVRAGLVLGVAWGASMGGFGTPVGTPPNLIGMRALADAGAPMTFFGWVKLGLPLAIVMQAALCALMWVAFFRGARVDIAPIQARDTGASSGALSGALSGASSGAWKRGERIAGLVFVLAVILWIFPGVLEALGSSAAKPVREHMPEEVVAIGCAALLFVTRTLTWKDAARIDWGTLLLFGGGVLLGDLANKTGLAARFGHALVDATGVSSGVAVVALIATASLFLSELASNTASATLMVPLAIGLAQSTHTSTTSAVLAAALGSSFGFIMPISTAPNAMAWATGHVKLRTMILAGLAFDAVGLIVVVAFLALLR